ncbi:MAG: type III secretion system inner membrane ring subunit SctD [Candidatus Endonucleobacter bathymodioli]|uniref:Type III secretion system inner membrane ring subunit SctD n=1 Tax=Candidatus Endonucleibacter bathymodioli TaxID=539814 RepID=A0AA90NUA6_9GAMM|nr:type III secretion system inner membrane ring subunit SctD [Candidatus Endonucleobacter bathymodioli]
MSEYYLKILSGNHNGAEIPLEAGRYTLGRADNCDLILTDTAISDIHLTIEISSVGALSVTTESKSPLYLNGIPEGDTLNFEYFDIVTSNGIHFAIGPANANWPDIEVPLLQKSESKHETADTPSRDNDFPDPDSSENEKTGTHSKSEAIDDITISDTDEDESPINIKLLIGIPVAFITLMSILAIFIFSEPEDTEDTEINTEITSLDQANLIKRQLQLDYIKFRQLSDGTILVKGYTKTLDKKEDLLSQLKDKKLLPKSQVIVMDVMQANAQALLKNRGYNSLTIEQDSTPGSLIINGYIITTDKLENVINMLKEEIYGLIAITDHVEKQSSRVKLLKSMIRDNGLASRVHLIEKADQVLVQGTILDEEQIYRLKEVANKFKALYGNQPKLVVSTKYSDDSNSDFFKQSGGQEGNNLKSSERFGGRKKNILGNRILVQGVSMGTIPYVVMKDGGKYFIGAKLDNGFIIEDINLDYLLLSDGSQSIKYYLGGKENGKNKQSNESGRN